MFGLFYFLRNLKLFYSPHIDQPQEELTNRTANDQRRARANLQYVASDEYEEIREPYYLEPTPMGIAGDLFFNLTFLF